MSRQFAILQVQCLTFLYLMPQIAFILHGKIPRKIRLSDELVQEFGTQHTLKFFPTTHHGHATSLAEQALSEGFTHLIAIGGDGTINEVANGIMNARTQMEEEAWEKIRLGILPKGTGNDFVKSLRLPEGIQGLANLIEADQFHYTDLGLVTFTTQDQQISSRYFTNITDLGLGGVVAEKLSRSSKWLGKTLTYQLAIIRTFLSYKHQAISVTSDSWSYEGSIMNFIIANGQYFGSGLGIAPEASLSDGLFDVIVVGEISVLDYLKNLPRLRKSLPIQHPEVSYHTATELTIGSPDKHLPIDMDGEFIGYAPMTVKVIKHAIKVLTHSC